MRPDFLPRELAMISIVSLALTLAACTPGGLQRGSRTGAATPVVDQSAASAAALAEYLELLQRLVQSAPAGQAETFMACQREYELAPTPTHQLRFALLLATPGHTGTDLPRAREMLRGLMATPETLLPSERAFAFLELQKVEQQLAYSAENKRLQNNASREDREKLAALNKRLQMETEENARLRKELDEARAKLDAIANIERSLIERKPKTEGRNP